LYDVVYHRVSFRYLWLTAVTCQLQLYSSYWVHSGQMTCRPLCISWLI